VHVDDSVRQKCDGALVCHATLADRPGGREIDDFPVNAPTSEIRLLEVNELIADMNDDTLEPVDFGVDTGSENEHKLFVLDVTPSQWDSIRRRALRLPAGWSLEHAVPFDNPQP
jgi:hypothetical protein